MFYNQYPYNLFSQEIIESMLKSQQSININQLHHIEQQENIMHIRKAISDYCDAARKVSPDYQQIALKACIDEIMIQAAKDGVN